MGLSRFIRFGIFVFIYLAIKGHVFATNEAGKDTTKPLNAENLVNLGRRLNNPLLRLLGYTLQESANELEGMTNGLQESFHELQCMVNPCGIWSHWSPCSSKFQKVFGTRTRIRQCGHQSPPCKSAAQPVNETETGLCEGSCLEAYNITSGGFCLKLIKDKINKTAAEAKCRETGGQLVHINSPVKSNDVVALVSAYSNSTFWIDGERSSVYRPWLYRNGTDPGTDVYLNWYSSEPSNGSTELCNAYVLMNGVYYRMIEIVLAAIMRFVKVYKKGYVNKPLHRQYYLYSIL